MGLQQHYNMGLQQHYNMGLQQHYNMGLQHYNMGRVGWTPTESDLVRGPLLDIWGGGGLELLSGHTKEMESLISYGRIGWKYLFRYLYYIYFNLLCQ